MLIYKTSSSRPIFQSKAGGVPPLFFYVSTPFPVRYNPRNPYISMRKTSTVLDASQTPIITNTYSFEALEFHFLYFGSFSFSLFSGKYSFQIYYQGGLGFLKAGFWDSNRARVVVAQLPKVFSKGRSTEGTGLGFEARAVAFLLCF